MVWEPPALFSINLTSTWHIWGYFFLTLKVTCKPQLSFTECLFFCKSDKLTFLLKSVRSLWDQGKPASIYSSYPFKAESLRFCICNCLIMFLELDTMIIYVYTVTCVVKFFLFICLCVSALFFLASSAGFAGMVFKELNPSVGTIWLSIIPFDSQQPFTGMKGNRNKHRFQWSK